MMCQPEGEVRKHGTTSIVLAGRPAADGGQRPRWPWRIALVRNTPRWGPGGGRHAPVVSIKPAGDNCSLAGLGAYDVQAWVEPWETERDPPFADILSKR
jgi:hypothetical protein